MKSTKISGNPRRGAFKIAWKITFWAQPNNNLSGTPIWCFGIRNQYSTIALPGCIYLLCILVRFWHRYSTYLEESNTGNDENERVSEHNVQMWQYELQMRMKSAGIGKVVFENFVLRRNTDCHPSAATRRLKISPVPRSLKHFYLKLANSVIFSA